MPNWPWSRRKSPEAAEGTRVEQQLPPQQPQQQPTTQQGRQTVAINPMEYSSKDTVLDVLRTERGNFYQIIDVPANWEAPTKSGHWQVRDLVGHMIDVTEGYLTRWDMARRGDPAPAGMGLAPMAAELDRVALTFRNLPREEAISRLKADSDRLVSKFDALTADEWGSFNVTHVFMGPLPLLFFPSFQIIDYGIHSWDMRWGLGDHNAKLAQRTAGILIPFMFIVIQNTVNQSTAEGFDASYGIAVDGDWGGKWKVTVQNGQLSYAPVEDLSGLSAVFHYRDESDFVLEIYGRIDAGEATGDPAVIDKVRHLYFAI
jgi:uncharacterized protein (TIGR03083 family)